MVDDNSEYFILPNKYVMTFTLFFNRNSAPEIVVTREGLPRQPLSVPATGTSSSMPVHPATAPGPPPIPPNCTGSGSSPAHGRRPTNRIEDRINRARARVWQTGQSTQSSIGPGAGAGNMNTRYGHSNNFLWFSSSLVMRSFRAYSSRDEMPFQAELFRHEGKNLA